MARGSTRSTEVNELTKQIISESVYEEYKSRGITNDINSLYVNDGPIINRTFLGRPKKRCLQLVHGIKEF